MRAAIFARVLLALLCFLGLATSASAECAWVLWVLVPGNLPEWEPADAFGGTNADVRCKQSAGIANGKETTRIETPTFDPRKTWQENEKDRQAQKAWTCFPATVDPRGPKGR